MEIDRGIIVDWGNTRVKVAEFDASEVKVHFFEHLDTSAILECISDFQPDALLIAETGSAPIELKKTLAKRYPTVLFNHTTPLPIEVDYQTRQTVGSDRLANAVNAWFTYENHDTIVVDAGTCITYDILKGNAFVGGAISPGLSMRGKAMNHFTARLPLVEPTEEAVEIIGDSTHTSLMSGMQKGWQLEIENMIHQIAASLKEPKVVITGGDLRYFDRALKSTIFADPYWTIRGYEQILRFNAA